MLWFLLTSHVAVSALGRVAQPIAVSSVRDKMEATMRIGSPHGLENKTVVFINCPNPYAISYLPPYRVHRNLPLPKNVRIIATGYNMYYFRRTDENTLLLETYKGNILRNRKRTIAWSVNFFKNLSESFRNFAAFPIEAGEKFKVTGFTAEVTEVDKSGRPTEVIYTFDRPLDDPSLIWLQWDWLKKSYEPFELPLMNRRITFPGPPRRQKADKK